MRKLIKLYLYHLFFAIFFVQGIKKYFKFGIGLEIARSIIYNYGVILRNPLKIFQVLLMRLNWNLVLFLSGYVGIYRVRYFYEFDLSRLISILSFYCSLLVVGAIVEICISMKKFQSETIRLHHCCVEVYFICIQIKPFSRIRQFQ